VQGCGLTIGQQALSVIATHADSGQESTLQTAVLQHVGVSTVSELVTWVYADTGWSHVASLAPVVVQCAKEGNSDALEIVTEQATAARSKVALALQKLVEHGNTAGLPVVLSGGLTKDPESEFMQRLMEHMQRDHPQRRTVWCALCNMLQC
jgi:N-acetylglucosamine kinase-like BadF-type ATPase